MQKASEIAFIRNGCMDAADFAFAWRAVAIQFERHFLPAWRGFLRVPEAAEWTISGYAEATQLIPGSHFPVLCVKSTGDAAVLGDHTGLKELWRAFGRSKPDPVTFSHEGLELPGDPWVNWWIKIPGTDDYEAGEVVDRVEGDTYTIEVDIAGEKRIVPVSNFLLPAAFGMGAGMPPYDWLGLLERPDQNRGYRIVRKADGSVVNEFAARGRDFAAAVESKRLDPLSRTARRFGGGGLQATP